jgi:hypothetical protein
VLGGASCKGVIFAACSHHDPVIRTSDTLGRA